MSTHDTESVPAWPPAGTTTAPVTGQVGSAHGPLPEVTLTMTDRVGAQVARTRSGLDGSFRFPALREGTYVVIVSRQGYQPRAETLVLGAAAGRALYVTLDPATSVHGTVRDRHSGEPVAAAAVTAVGSSGDVIASTVSDPDGGYRLTGIDGTEITLVAAADAADPVATVVALEQDGDRPHHVVDLALDTHRTLTGTITAGGRAVPGLRLTLRDERGHAVGDAVTGDDGGYRFDQVKAGTYTLHSHTSAPQVRPISAEATRADVVLSPSG